MLIPGIRWPAGNKYLRIGNDRRRFISNRVRDENECVWSGNDYGCRLNNYFAGGKGRVVDGLNRRWGADNCVGVINDR
ncbi:MAG: hypothetical protein DMG20_03150 [Acidobacteria bacterium]|nr:MAG: hypothetical protein DMG20_03150 [Acidobacteriota bacterium]